MSPPARHRRPRQSLVAAALLLLLFPPSGARAQAAAPDWNASFRDASAALHAGEWARARTTIEALLAEMRETIASGEGSAPSLGVATMYRAIAAAGLGEEEAADWDLRAALSLFPSLADADLGGFGDAGRRLDAARRAPPPVTASAAGRALSRPQRRSGEIPRFPFGKAQVCSEQAVKVRVVIGADGVPRRPRVDAGTDPVLAFAAMEALRSWRFEPARQEGLPVAVAYALTIDYQVVNCPAAAPAPARPRDADPSRPREPRL